MPELLLTDKFSHTPWARFHATMTVDSKPRMGGNMAVLVGITSSGMEVNACESNQEGCYARMDGYQRVSIGCVWQ